MCDYVVRTETLPMAEIMPAGTGNTEHRIYCQRPGTFWVQSLVSTHSLTACPSHLARIVREVEKAAREYDILHPNYIGQENVKEYYVRPARKVTAGGKEWTVSESVTRGSSNYARVTVKLINGK